MVARGDWHGALALSGKSDWDLAAAMGWLAGSAVGAAISMSSSGDWGSASTSSGTSSIGGVGGIVDAFGDLGDSGRTRNPVASRPSTVSVAGRLPGSPGEAVSRFRDDTQDISLVLDVWLDVSGAIAAATVAPAAPA